MRLITKKHISRRTLLRGIGTAVALPLLDSMVPAQTPLAKTAANPEIKLGMCFIPHGAVMANWTPAAEGADFKLSRTLAPVEPFKDQIVVVSNLAHKMAAPGGPGDNGGDHTRSPAVFLNGVHPKRTDGADIRAGVAIDQIAPEKIGQERIEQGRGILDAVAGQVRRLQGNLGAADRTRVSEYLDTVREIERRIVL